MRAAQITPKKIHNIIKGAEDAGREVESFEIDGIVVKLVTSDEGKEGPAPEGLGEKKWSKS